MTTGIKLDEEIKNRLKLLGDKMDRSPHWLMKQAIEDYLNQQERYWREKEEDQARWEEYVLTGDAVDNEQVMEWLDSVGTEHEKPCPR